MCLSLNEPNSGCQKSLIVKDKQELRGCVLFWLAEQPSCALCFNVPHSLHYIGLRAAERAACLLCEKFWAVLFP